MTLIPIERRISQFREETAEKVRSVNRPNASLVCSACKMEPATRSGMCAPCFNAYMRARRMLGRDSGQRVQTIGARERLKAELVEMKGGKCVRCGFAGDTAARRAAMHFHHRGRVFTFRISTGASRNREAILAELAKCDLLCANCHIVEHYGEKRGAGRPRKPIDKRVKHFLAKLVDQPKS